MSSFRQSIYRMFKGAATSFWRFPAAMVSAVALTILTSLRIALDDQSLAVTLSRMQWALALTVFINLALAAFWQIRQKAEPGQGHFDLLAIVLHLGGLLLVFPIWLLIRPTQGSIPGLVISRMAACAAIAFIAFILIISRNDPRTDFNQRFFMIHKSFFIALLYMLVIMGGLNFIALAVKSLLLPGMDTDIYQHLSTWSGLVGFALFLGYFPDFRPVKADPHVEQSQKQPRFIEILLIFILIPIFLVLSLVLLLWTIRILLTAAWPEFSQLATILNGFVLGGIWLIIMTTRAEQVLPRIFHRIYPFLVLLFLGFEGFALVREISDHGILGSEYAAAVLWLMGLAGAVLILVRSRRAGPFIGLTAIGLIALSVLPGIGYRDLPMISQENRLESTLLRNQMLQDNVLVTTTAEPAETDRILITSTTYYLLSYRDEYKLPAWLPVDLTDNTRFAEVYGFEPAWDSGSDNTDWQYGSAMRPAGVLDTRAYQYAILPGVDQQSGTFEITGEQGLYKFTWINDPDGIPELILKRDHAILIQQDFEDFLIGLANKSFDKTQTKESVRVLAEDMQLELTAEGIHILVVFTSIDSNRSSAGDYTFNVNWSAIYFGETG